MFRKTILLLAGAFALATAEHVKEEHGERAEESSKALRQAQATHHEFVEEGTHLKMQSGGMRMAQTSATRYSTYYRDRRYYNAAHRYLVYAKHYLRYYYHYRRYAY